MTVEELRALKSELQQCSQELRELKKELLATRTEELERAIRAPARRGH